MADNRMWLVHKPTRTGVLIGKKWGDWNYYESDMAEFLKDKYDDDFVLLMEHQKGWDYTQNYVDGFRVFEL